ncbi:hypothetical protein J2Z22_000210 [Paenibacillus forsythiae]|uniref:Uncharacterized protein n=1 Tax=Paenibacillus forsythiae TaxID=365616 RepID=A0ABU3H1L1_9BACL|nr:hypothetical protein [Paenibacillus forsythiae]
MNRQLYAWNGHTATGWSDLSSRQAAAPRILTGTLRA